MSSVTSARIHLSVPHLGTAEHHEVANALASNWITSAGPHLDEFEHGLRALLGRDHLMAVSSGTAALHLALRAAGVGPADAVAVQSLTFAGSLFPVLYLGARPILIDSETRTWNIDPYLVSEYFADCARHNTLPKALIAVNLYGQHAQLDSLLAICNQYGVVLIEDAAESLGASFHGKPTGNAGHYAVLSFNGNKIVTTSGGGAVIAPDEAKLAQIRKWANQSREPAVEYLHNELGYNYRLSNISAAIGVGQLAVLETRVQQRRAVFTRYVEALRTLPAFIPQPEAPEGIHSRWLSVFQLDPIATQLPSIETIVKRLGADNIEARPVWRPMHTQPLLTGAITIGGSVSFGLYRHGICLPSSSSLSTDEQERVVSALTRAVQSP